MTKGHVVKVVRLFVVGCFISLFILPLALATTAISEISFGGEYRINAYHVDNDNNMPDKQTTSRVRIRQNIDIKFSKQVATKLQLTLEDTTGNSSSTEEIRVRYAVIQYTTNRAIYTSGIVPFSDRFGDTLFSSAWDYNPVGLVTTINIGGGSIRFGALNLNEGVEENADDDTVHYQLDYQMPIGNIGAINLGASLLQTPPLFQTPGTTNTGSYNHSNIGIGVTYKIGIVDLNAFIMNSTTDRALLGTAKPGSGIAAKLELAYPTYWGDFAVMVTQAGGESDGSGFIPLMGLIGHQGYWGYTGLLSVQGTTDTGFNSDAINISNNGYGLTTVQTKYTFPVTTDLMGYVAVGWYGNTQAAGRNSTIGIDVIALATYTLSKIISLDVGAAFAQLEDSVSSYEKRTVEVTTENEMNLFNQTVGVSRNKTALFMRLLAKF